MERSDVPEAEQPHRFFLRAKKQVRCGPYFAFVEFVRMVFKTDKELGLWKGSAMERVRPDVDFNIGYLDRLFGHESQQGKLTPSFQGCGVGKGKDLFTINGKTHDNSCLFNAKQRPFCRRRHHRHSVDVPPDARVL